jgi:hypothetical protein
VDTKNKRQVLRLVLIWSKAWTKNSSKFFNNHFCIDPVNIFWLLRLPRKFEYWNSLHWCRWCLSCLQKSTFSLLICLTSKWKMAAW